MRSDVAELTRLRRAFTAAPPTGPPRADCPPADRIWEAVHGRLSPPELREVLDHVAGCPACTEAWRLADHLKGNSEEEGEEEAPTRQRTAWRGWLQGAGMAAAASVLLVVGIQLRDSTPETPVLRTAGSEPIELLSTGALPRSDCRLRWQGPEDAVYYDLRVTTAADPLSPLVEETELETLEYRVPPEALAGLPPDAELLVRLEASHPIEGRWPAVTFSVVVR